ncbi:sensor histidine kinase [Nocardioides abyssi]|uniref:Sensor-like histidine kinase SenX3 n=1 Tax=Nocardioides abyssi TaxID=3058370 RepID=A0ABT8ERB3_9ACTN|nr:GAF domain-containing sensor histidine kinase [Nocardioides abyssi]MDN4160690.1 GAF domain-containing sensor histidine kinase [Nocardioides abyssi]
MTATHETDEVRVAQIGEYQVITRPPRSDLVALVEIAAQVAQVPLATINLITDTHQHQIATAGFDASVCAREDSMCNAVLHEPAPVVLEDASKDPRFAENPFVTGEIGDVRFYATHQLRTPSGVVIGTLCVFDTQPRTITDEQEHALQALADRVVDLLELELRTRELSASVERLEEVQTELRRSNEQLAAFAGQVSHDLRNPLTAVSMALRMLSDEIAEKEAEREPGLQYLLARAISGAGRMQSLIDDLLAFARLGGELQRRPVDLDAVMRDVVDDLSTALQGATLVVEPLPVVTGDPVQLRAVLQNLVANAAKFTRPGEKAHVTVCADKQDGAWRIAVVDRGIGVPAEQRHRVFQPLARVDDSVEGSGIGLTTCRRIVEAHGGRIGLEESPEGGTTAWFQLPEA